MNHVVRLYGADDELADQVRDVGQPHVAVADQRSFPAERNSVRAARHYVTDLLGEAADDMAACDAAIVATELAANAVLHARSGFTMTVSRSAARTRIAVRDNTPLANTGLVVSRPEVPRPEVTRPEASGRGVPFQVMAGHGLSLVSQLASRWAVDPLPDGKVVWAELPVAELPVAWLPVAWLPVRAVGGSWRQRG